MSDIDINQLLGQMRATASRLEQALPEAAQAEGPEKGGFGQLLKDSIDAVNESQQAGREQAQAFEMGDPNADLTEVMVQLQKANLSFRAMTEVRNKLVNAYQEIMNMPI